MLPPTILSWLILAIIVMQVCCVDPYLILRLPPGAQQAEVHAQYRQLVASLGQGDEQDFLRQIY